MSPCRDKRSLVLFEKARSQCQQVKHSLHKEKENRARAEVDDGDLAVLPAKRRRWRVLLGDDLDMKVQMYLKKVREGGGVILARIAMATARGIVLTCDRSLLVEFGGHVELSKHWAYSLLHHMKFVQRKVTTAKSKHTNTNFTGCGSHSGDGRNSSRANPQLDCPKQHLDYRSERCQASGSVWSQWKATNHSCLLGIIHWWFSTHSSNLPRKYCMMSSPLWVSTRVWHHPFPKTLVKWNNDPVHWEDHHAVHRQCTASLFRWHASSNHNGQLQGPDHQLSHQSFGEKQLIASNLWIYLWTSQQKTSWRDDLKIGTRSR